MDYQSCSDKYLHDCYMRDVYVQPSHINTADAYFRHTPIESITRTDIRCYRDSLRLRMAPATVNRYLTYLRAVFYYARDELLQEIPVNHLFKNQLYVVPYRNAFYTRSQWSSLISAANKGPKYLTPFLTFMLYTGMRPTECLSLEWSQVDFIECTLHLPSAGHRKRIKALTIPLHARAIEALLDIRDIQEEMFPGETHKHIFYFRTPWNKYGHRIKSIERAFDNAMKRAGLKDTGLTIRDIRHTCASWLRQRGTDVSAIKELLGHSKLETTMRYAHVNVAHLRSQLIYH